MNKLLLQQARQELAEIDSFAFKCRLLFVSILKIHKAALFDLAGSLRNLTKEFGEGAFN
jgi:hypothetical protein